MGEDSSSDEKEVERPLVAKSAVDLQRLKLQKLMKNPDKPVIIPERPKVKGTPSVPEFVRNVMGSSAGAGSGEFHVYRHLRRKEYSRQKFIQEKGQKELLDEEYHQKLEENKKLADEITAKKRAKRLKKKQKLKQKKFKPSDKNKNKNNQKTDSDKSDSENESSDEEKSNINEKTEDSQDKIKYQDQTQEGSESGKNHVIKTEKNEEMTKMDTEDENIQTEKNDKTIKTEKGDENNEIFKTDKNDENINNEEDNKKIENADKIIHSKENDKQNTAEDNINEAQNDEVKPENTAVESRDGNCT